MAGHADPSRDLRLALQAFETGAVDRDRLLASIEAWARAADLSLAEILARTGAVDASTIALLCEQVARDLADRATPESQPDDDQDERNAVDPLGIATVDHVSGSIGLPRGALGDRRYQVLRPHAKGGLGEVFIAFDRELNRSVALKELQPRLAHDTAAQARFLLEAEVTGKLAHPGIVPVYSLGRHDDGRPYYAMHLIEGETLRAAITRFHESKRETTERGDRELAFRRLLRSVIDACNAVAYAHSRGVIHRDLKPENIMLGRFGETQVVDWGVAKVTAEVQSEIDESAHSDGENEDSLMTQPGTLVGTPRYMSPEQAARDRESIGASSDIYSLGAILYCVLVGHDAFPDGDTKSILRRVRRGIFPGPRRLNRSLDPALETICLKAMSLIPADRHATALALAHDLETWLADVRYRGEQELALSQMKGTLARLCLERAHNSFGRGTHPDGMLWLARALENAPSEPSDLERVIRTSLSAWHSWNKQLERSFRHGAQVHAVAFDADARKLATAGEDNAVQIWDISTGSALVAPLPHQGPVRAVAFNAQTKLLLTAGDDGKIRRWHAASGDSAGPPVDNEGPIETLVLNFDGTRIAASGAGRWFLWNSDTGEPIAARTKRHDRLLAIAFSPDGKSLAVASGEGSVELHDADDGRSLGVSLVHESAVVRLEFDSRGRYLLAATAEGRARLWDVARAVEAVTMTDAGDARCLAFRPDGDAFAIARGDGSARLWETATGRPVGEPIDHRARVDCLAFRPDGTILATAGSDGLIRFWCASTGLPIGPALHQSGLVRSLVFSHDGRRLATAGTDTTVRCWRTPSPLEADVERISCWVRVTTDLEFDAGDAIRRMEGAASWELRRRLTELGGPPVR